MIRTTALIALVLLSACASSTPFPSATPEAVTSVTQIIFPSVVRLDVAQQRFADGRKSVTRGIGSGVIIDNEGRVLTNYHVAGRAVEIFITLSNKERVPAKLVGSDHWTDLAIVQLDMEHIREKNISFEPAELGDSDTLVVGQDVMAIGTPFGLARTVTLGIVSNRDRTFYPRRMTINEYETGDFNNWIQMDTPINPGNSGGPLVDMTGKVVGINTRGGGQNLNFAIPINKAKLVIAEIMATATDEKEGYVRRADLGMQLKPLQDLESFYDLDINRGVLVDSVDRFSAAKRAKLVGEGNADAGVKTQDILLAVDDTPTNVRFPEELARVKAMIASLPTNKPVTLTLKRGDDVIKMQTTPDKLESRVGEEAELKVWGVSVRDVTRPYASDRILDDDKGVLVTTTTRGLPADKAELENRDVIRLVNGEEVEDLEALQALYKKSVDAKQEKVLLEIKRGRRVMRKVLTVTFKDDEPAKVDPAKKDEE